MSPITSLLGFKFYKYQATGNDFILVDHESFDPLWVKTLCQRRYSIGADGVIWMRPSQKATCRMVFFNCDGQEARMCLNGLRSLALHLALENHFDTTYSIETAAGIYTVCQSSIQLPPIKEHKLLTINDLSFNWVNSGVEHVVIEQELDGLLMEEVGKEWRLKTDANVNFIEKESDHSLRVRTYERGVEGETLSCGTGAYACHFVLGVSKSRINFYHGDSLFFEERDQKTWMSGNVKRLYIGNMAENLNFSDKISPAVL